LSAAGAQGKLGDTMAQFVLVHGSFHGPWCWERVTPLLLAAGHEVITPALADAATRFQPGLHDYARHVAAAVRRQAGPVVLVGHSMGGIVITQAAELVAHKISKLVYVTGLLLPVGESLQSFMRGHADVGVEDLVLKNMKLSADGALASFPAQAAYEVFYNRCTLKDAAWAAGHLCDQPTAVYATPIAVTAENFGSLPRAYIECLDDVALSIKTQRRMTALTPCQQVVSVDADHSPFLSAPESLVSQLLMLASRSA
jgi:pimeloyl-ACP methyl ester carboxylesterase